MDAYEWSQPDLYWSHFTQKIHMITTLVMIMIEGIISLGFECRTSLLQITNHRTEEQRACTASKLDQFQEPLWPRYSKPMRSW
jgi:hypothetical protein